MTSLDSLRKDLIKGWDKATNSLAAMEESDHESQAEPQETPEPETQHQPKPEPIKPKKRASISDAKNQRMPKRVAKVQDIRSNCHELEFARAHKYMFTRPGFNQLRDEICFKSADGRSKDLAMCIYQTAVKQVTENALVYAQYRKAKTIETKDVKFAAEKVISRQGTSVVDM